MLSLNFILGCNAILNLPLYKFVFPISMSSEYFNVCSFYFMFFAIVFKVHLPPFHVSNFTYQFQLIIHASPLRIKLRRILPALRSTIICPTNAMLLTFLLRKELQDSVPGTPEPHNCSKSKLWIETEIPRLVFFLLVLLPEVEIY